MPVQHGKHAAFILELEGGGYTQALFTSCEQIAANGHSGAAADIGQWPAFSTQGAVLMLSHPKEEANGLVLCMTRPLNSIQFFFVMTRYRLLEQSAYFLWCLLKLEATKCPCFLKA